MSSPATSPVSSSAASSSEQPSLVTLLPAPAPAPAPAPSARKGGARRPVATTGSRASRKPPVVATVTPEGVDGSLGAEQRPLIAHLPVSTSHMDFVPTGVTDGPVYDPAPPALPQPYDEHGEELSYLEGIPRGEGVGLPPPPPPSAEEPDAAAADGAAAAVEASVAATTNEVLAAPSDLESAVPASAPSDFDALLGPVASVPAEASGLKATTLALPPQYSERLMVQYQDSNRTQSLPERTALLCFWCCHGFDVRPCVIPSHITRDVWHVYGNFCSPNCAAAHLFRERLDAHVQWERFALLNRLYAPLTGSAPAVRCAPPREVLRAFGGSFDIREYRGVVAEGKLRIDVLTPPVVSIIQTMDTKPIDFYDQSLRNVFIAHDARQRLAGAGAQGLRLRRTKPIKDWENTLECVMRLGGGGSSSGPGVKAQHK